MDPIYSESTVSIIGDFLSFCLGFAIVMIIGLAMIATAKYTAKHGFKFKLSNLSFKRSSK